MVCLLLLSESTTAANLLAESLRQLSYAIDVVTDCNDSTPNKYDAVLLVLNAQPIEFIARCRKQLPYCPIIVLTELGQEDLTLTALQAGATSFVSTANIQRDIGDTLSEVLHTSNSQLKRTMFLKRLTSSSQVYTLENDTEYIGLVVTQAEVLLQQFKLFDDSDRMRIGVAIHEALVNAMIHGNLEVPSSLKNENWDEYHRLIAQRAQRKPYMDRRVHVLLHADKANSFRVVIRDEGPGFDVAALLDPTETDGCEKCSGRGMLLIRTFFDEVRHNARGNEITMTKLIRADTL